MEAVLRHQTLFYVTSAYRSPLPQRRSSEAVALPCVAATPWLFPGAPNQRHSRCWTPTRLVSPRHWEPVLDTLKTTFISYYMHDLVIFKTDSNSCFNSFETKSLNSPTNSTPVGPPPTIARDSSLVISEYGVRGRDAFSKFSKTFLNFGILTLFC